MLICDLLKRSFPIHTSPGSNSRHAISHVCTFDWFTNLTIMKVNTQPESNCLSPSQTHQRLLALTE